MRYIVSLALAALVLAVFAMAEGKEFYDINNAESLFNKFVTEYNRKYSDEADREAHYQAFKANLVKMNKMNEQSPSATFGINKFADYTEAERQQMFGLRKKD